MLEWIVGRTTELRMPFRCLLGWLVWRLVVSLLLVWILCRRRLTWVRPKALKSRGGVIGTFRVRWRLVLM